MSLLDKGCNPGGMYFESWERTIRPGTSYKTTRTYPLVPFDTGREDMERISQWLDKKLHDRFPVDRVSSSLPFGLDEHCYSYYYYY
jgi:hypothetical protein